MSAKVYISLIYLKLKILLVYIPDFTQFAVDSAANEYVPTVRKMSAE